MKVTERQEIRKSLSGRLQIEKKRLLLPPSGHIHELQQIKHF